MSDKVLDEKMRRIFTIIWNHLKEPILKEIQTELNIVPTKLDLVGIDYRRHGTDRSKVYIVDYYNDVGLEGPIEYKVVIKFSPSFEDFEKEYGNLNKIKRTIKPFEDAVKVPELLYSNKNLKCLIYEGIKGKTYLEMEYPPEIKSYLVGRALAAFHGDKLKPVDVEAYNAMFLFALKYLQFSDEMLKLFVDLSLPFVHSIQHSEGGANIFGDFHQENVMFEVNPNVINPTTGFPEVQTYFIDPEFYTEGQRDRLEDIATFFSKQIQEEFMTTSSISNTQRDLAYFLIGYDEYLKRITGGKTLGDLYPELLPIDFQVVIFILLDLTSALRKNPNVFVEFPDELNRRLELIFNLLENKVLHDTYLNKESYFEQ